MAEIRAFGLKSIKIGAIEQFATLEALGVTYKDTADLIQDDDSTTEIFSEENDNPELVLSTKGRTTLKWTIMDVAPKTLVKVLGGTVTTVTLKDTWNEPAATVNIEKSIEIVTVDGTVIRIARAKIVAKKNFAFRKQGVLLIEITAQVLKPSTVSALPPVSVAEPVA